MLYTRSLVVCLVVFFFNDTATTEIYTYGHTLSLHDALPISRTYAFGAVDAEIRDMWDLEKEAQAAAFDAVQPGAPCESVDAAARRVLERAGLEIGRAHV